MQYPNEMVENMLRAYYTLQQSPDPEYSDLFIDLSRGLKTLKKNNKTLYYTVVNVFVNGIPIQDYATDDGVTTRMITYRLTDGLELLTRIMNGDTNYEG